MNKVKQILVDWGYEDVIVFDDPTYDNAFIGITMENEAVYDYEKMVEQLINEENMDYESAADFIHYNYSYMPKKQGYPIIINKII